MWQKSLKRLCCLKEWSCKGNMEDKSKICCGVLEKMPISWMALEDGTKCMPYIIGEDGVKYRVNHCPSCGAYVRECMIKPLPTNPFINPINCCHKCEK
jgi:hypothetical protein